MTDTVHNALRCGACIVAAHGVSHVLLSPCAETTIWFSMHVIVNLATAWYAFPSLAHVLRGDPHVAIPHPTGHDYTPVLSAFLLHLYHCAVFRISPDDRFHHVMFALVMGVPSILYANEAVNAMLFAISGIPGAIIYTVIVSRRLGWTRVSEPRVSVLVNLFVRLPLVVWINASYLSTPTVLRPPAPVVFTQVFLSTSNAIGYSLQALVRARRGPRKK